MDTLNLLIRRTKMLCPVCGGLVPVVGGMTDAIFLSCGHTRAADGGSRCFETGQADSPRLPALAKI
jgi:hypothetical protein